MLCSGQSKSGGKRPKNYNFAHSLPVFVSRNYAPELSNLVKHSKNGKKSFDDATIPKKVLSSGTNSKPFVRKLLGVVRNVWGSMGNS